MKLWPSGSAGPRKLSPDLEEVLERRFNLTSFEMAEYRYVRTPADVANGSVREYVRVFDPRMIPARSQPKSYEEVAALQHVILFEGSVDKKGNIRLFDRRPRNRTLPDAA